MVWQGCKAQAAPGCWHVAGAARKGFLCIGGFLSRGSLKEKELRLNIRRPLQTIWFIFFVHVSFFELLI